MLHLLPRCNHYYGTKSPHVGLVIGERAYNVPPQVMPPMYRMMQDEISWAVEEASKLLV